MGEELTAFLKKEIGKSTVLPESVRYSLGELSNTLSYASLLQKYDHFTITYCNLSHKSGSKHLHFSSKQAGNQK